MRYVGPPTYLACMRVPAPNWEAQVIPFPNDGIVGCAVPNAIAAVPPPAITRERYCWPVQLEVEPIGGGAGPGEYVPCTMLFLNECVAPLKAWHLGVMAFVESRGVAVPPPF